MSNTNVFDCTLLQFSINHREVGNITAVNAFEEIPFEIKRVYFIYDVPGGESRGGHGHKNLQQLIVAASGSFDVTVNDGKVKRTFSLSRPNIGLLLPPGLWRELDNFSSGSICLVLASIPYDEKDYLRDYQTFLDWKFNR
jgi:hypothetical protein